MHTDICKKLDRIIELLEQKKELKEKEDYDPKKHGDLKNYIRQRQMEYGIYATDKTDEHISRVVEEMRESYDDFLGLKGRQ